MFSGNAAAWRQRTPRLRGERKEKLFLAFLALPSRSLRFNALWCRPRLLRREWIHFVEDANGLEHHAAHDLQALRAELVDCILGCVPENVVVAVCEIDE